MAILQQKVTYVVQMRTTFASFEDASREAPAEIQAHLARSRELEARGDLLLAGVFLDDDGTGLQTMAVLASREAAEEFARGDPFVLAGMVREWRVREWANMLA